MAGNRQIVGDLIELGGGAAHGVGLEAVDGILLHGGVDVIVGQGDRLAAQGLKDGHMHGGLHAAQLQARHVVQSFNGLVGVKMAEGLIQEGQSDNSDLLLHSVQQPAANIALGQNAVHRLEIVVPDIGHIASHQNIGEVCNGGRGGDGYIQGAHLQHLHHLHVAAQLAAGVELNLDTAVRVLFHVLFEALGRGGIGMVVLIGHRPSQAQSRALPGRS